MNPVHFVSIAWFHRHAADPIVKSFGIHRRSRLLLHTLARSFEILPSATTPSQSLHRLTLKTSNRLSLDRRSPWPSHSTWHDPSCRSHVDLPSARSRSSVNMLPNRSAVDSIPSAHIRSFRSITIDRPFMDYLSPGTMFFSSVTTVIPGIISVKCWMTRDPLVVQKISLTEIISAVVLLANVVVVVVDLLESSMLLTQLCFNLLTGAHLLLMEH